METSILRHSGWEWQKNWWVIIPSPQSNKCKAYIEGWRQEDYWEELLRGTIRHASGETEEKTLQIIDRKDKDISELKIFCNHWLLRTYFLSSFREGPKEGDWKYSKSLGHLYLLFLARCFVKIPTVVHGTDYTGHWLEINRVEGTANEFVHTYMRTVLICEQWTR